jgi:hypothetical protein
MVPTFCAEELLKLMMFALTLGSARAGDGDLPLVGDDGGEPKRDSASSMVD